MAVAMAEDGRMLHHLEGDVPFTVGETVAGVVDWPRRLEMLQQHTGQHILSQAFFQLFGAETRGFRIFEQVAEIDLTLDGSPDELTAAIGQAEELANAVVFEDRVVRLHTVTPKRQRNCRSARKISTPIVSASLKLPILIGRRAAAHARRTGEVGLIAVRGWERAKRMTRVQFVCGGRALCDYRAANQTATSVARRLSVGRDEALEAVARLLEEHKKLERRARALVELATKAEAQELLATTPVMPTPRILRIFDGRDFDDVKRLAHHLVADQGVLALLATRTRDLVRLVCARSADLPVAANTLLQPVCEQLGGRSGGKPEFAQGSGTRVADLEHAMAQAVASHTA